jgi:hypothetical protein
MENLACKKDSGTQSGGTERVKRSRQPFRSCGCERAAYVERRHQSENQREAPCRREFVPMCGHEEEQAGAQHDDAEDDC